MKLARVDDRHRILIPDLKPGKAFTWQNDGNGQITLLEVKVSDKKTRHSDVLAGLKPLTAAQAERCWGKGSEEPEWDEFVAHCASLPAGPPSKDE